MQNLCPCNSNKSYVDCCQPLHQGKKVADNIEDLMRSRYSAFAKTELDYIFHTHHPKTIHEINQEETAQWAKESTWKGFEIINVKGGTKKDDTGTVEFKAYYAFRGEDKVHSEIAQFERFDGKWKFLTSELPKGKTVRREEPKVGRNDPCSCGSNKKFKKCCGK